jgi:hypothetical protein
MYSPKIKESLIPILYRLKKTTGKPMTQIVNEAVLQYLIKQQNKEDKYVLDNHNS